MISAPPEPVAIKLMPGTEYNGNQFSVVGFCIVGKVGNDFQVSLKYSMMGTSR